MKIDWFKNPDNVIYADINEFADNFGKETGISGLRNKLEQFRENPTKEGMLLRGTKRTTLKIFIPDMYFEDEEKLDMGDTVWIYMGEYYPCYCLYWPISLNTARSIYNAGCSL